MRAILQWAWLISIGLMPLSGAVEFVRTNYVQNLSDSGPGSLRQAIVDAEQGSLPTKIVCTGIQGGISVSGNLPTLKGVLWLDLSGIVLTGGGSMGLIVVATNADCRITGVEIANVSVTSGKGVAPLVNSGSLRLENVSFHGNYNRTGLGGAILNHGTLAVSFSQIRSNTASGNTDFGGWTDITISGLGGGIYHDGLSLLVVDSNLEGNNVRTGYHGGSAPSDGTVFGGMAGGGLYIAGGTVVLTRVSIVDNHADEPAGLAPGSGGGVTIGAGQLLATNCTIARNIAHGTDSFSRYVNGHTLSYPATSSYGGAVEVGADAHASLVYCTISKNQSQGGDQGQAPGYGGGIYGRAQVKACVITENYADVGNDVYNVTTLGENVIGNPNGMRPPLSTDVVSPAGPVLNAIAQSVDGRWYYSLPEMSAARDIANFYADSDELQHSRPAEGFTDAGSYEAEVVAPAIQVQPKETVLLTPGATASVALVASGTRPLKYELLLGGKTVRVSTNSNFVFTDRDAAGDYQIRVANQVGSIVSGPIRLTFNSALSFVQEPTSQLVELGGTVDFTASVSGHGPFLFQWTKNGVVIPDATNSFVRIVRARAEDLGTYQVAVSNGSEQIASAPARLDLSPTIFVSSLADHGPGTLRDAVERANSMRQVPFNILLTNSGTLFLESPLEGNGQLRISNSAPTLVISGGKRTQFMRIGTNSLIELCNLRLEQFEAAPGLQGGAIWNRGKLMLRRCTIAECSASFGGAIFNSADLVLQECSLLQNVANGADGAPGNGVGGGGAGMGGAIYNVSGSAALTNTIVSGNQAQGGASGIFDFTKGPGSGGNAYGTEFSEFGGGGSGGVLGPLVDLVVPRAGVPGVSGGFGGGGGGGHSVTYSPERFGLGGVGGFGGADGPQELTNHLWQGDSRGGGGAGFGGGIFLESGALNLSHCTVVSNSASGGSGFQPGKGIGGGLFALSGDAKLLSTVVVNNSAERMPDTYGLARTNGPGEAPDPAAVESTGLATLSQNVEVLRSGVITAPTRSLSSPGDLELHVPKARQNKQFTHWKGDFEDLNSQVSFTKSGNGVPAASSGYAILAETAGNGTVQVVPPKPVYAEGELVRLTPVADQGWSFSHWSGDASGPFSPLIIEAHRNRRIAANFVPRVPTIVPFNFTQEENVSAATMAPSGDFCYVARVYSSSEQRNTLKKLDSRGNVTVVSALPSGYLSQLAIGPDGEAYALRDSAEILQILNGVVSWRFPFTGTFVGWQAGDRLCALFDVPSEGDHRLSFLAPSGALSADARFLPYLPSTEEAYQTGHVLFAGKDANSTFVTVNPLYHATGFSWLPTTNTSNRLHFSAILAFDQTGAVNRTVPLPPALIPQRTIPVLDGFICAGFYDTNSTAAPLLTDAPCNFFVAKLSPEGAVEWISLGLAKLLNLDLAVDVAEESIYFAVGNLGFTFNGQTLEEGLGSTIFRLDFEGHLQGAFTVLASPPFLGFGADGAVYVASGNGVFANLRSKDRSPPPPLSVSKSSRGVELSWPADERYVLQHRGSVGTEESWVNYPVSPTAGETTYSVDKSPSERQEFFQLR